MTFETFRSLTNAESNPVILLEGRRSIPPQMAKSASALSARLAREFPQLRFRSGNASGSDQAFTEGVLAVDPSRMEIFAPYSSHRAKARHAAVSYNSPESLDTVEEEQTVFNAIRATPQNKGLIEKRHRNKALGAKAAYLIRDTMKVMGNGPDYLKPCCALFYIDPDDPMNGGTGHTIRACQQAAIPVVFQTDWDSW